MNADSLASMGSDLWWLAYGWLIAAGVLSVIGLSALYKAVWVCRHRDIAQRYPELAALFEKVKPPPHWLHALGFFAAAGVSLIVAATLRG